MHESTLEKCVTVVCVHSCLLPGSDSERSVSSVSRRADLWKGGFFGDVPRGGKKENKKSFCCIVYNKQNFFGGAGHSFSRVFSFFCGVSVCLF